MLAIQDVRQQLSDWRWRLSLRRTRSRLPRQDAARYKSYLEKCQRAFVPIDPAEPAIESAAEQFRRDGYCIYRPPEGPALAGAIVARIREQEAKSGEAVWTDWDRYQGGDVYQTFPEVDQLWRGSAGRLLRGIYKAHFKIFYSTIYRSLRRKEDPDGSQLWHADGGPGTCVITMFTLSEVGPRNGGISFVPWDASRRIMESEPILLRPRLKGLGDDPKTRDRDGYRRVICDFYAEEIERGYRGRIVQPTEGPGTIICFTNNVIHKGGFPDPGESRLVSMYHVYPSMTATPFDRYLQQGTPKTAGNPSGPEF